MGYNNGRVNILGPFVINFDDGVDPIKLVDLPEGTRIIGASCFIDEIWDQDPDAAQIAVSTSADPHDEQQSREMFRWLIGDNWATGDSSVSRVNAFEVVGAEGPNIGTIVFSSTRGCVMTADGAAYVTLDSTAGATRGSVQIELMTITPLDAD